eukprot:CAMPEP_0113930866 /NCGR_PEP_ID=MMETSP1159-20121227/6202_1 /TAXON_ID=88271 /ORGANISM="Picocystis salinarum" /LENGTH=88 /DNA_ID=CAMNT_0000931725 /DNA_START=405 /DNA_END=671 /DNA_ORIENTATION=- /assembly_acc=CAM_ASM_000767
MSFLRVTSTKKRSSGLHLAHVADSPPSHDTRLGFGAASPSLRSCTSHAPDASSTSATMSRSLHVAKQLFNPVHGAHAIVDAAILVHVA